MNNQNAREEAALDAAVAWYLENKEKNEYKGPYTALDEATWVYIETLTGSRNQVNYDTEPISSAIQIEANRIQRQRNAAKPGILGRLFGRGGKRTRKHRKAHKKSRKAAKKSRKGKSRKH